jgi:hypothetical protein
MADFDSSDDDVPRATAAPSNPVPDCDGDASLDFPLHWVTEMARFGCAEKCLAASGLPGAKFRSVRRNLETDLANLASEDFNLVVCLLEEREFSKFRVPGLLARYDAISGLECKHLPIGDGMAPEIETLVRRE